MDPDFGKMQFNCDCSTPVRVQGEHKCGRCGGPIPGEWERLHQHGKLAVTGYKRGQSDAMRWAVRWLHERAKEMNDPHAKQVLDAAAFKMGNDAKQTELLPLDDDCRFVATKRIY